ncbi:MAG: lipase maturation factor family protein [Bdellovibrionales bacterium]|nr:lipase maturation factor family protein [Bdellovibrionales bacterium]
MGSSYALSSWIFTRALCLVYIIAFLSLASQARGLWGAQGVLPIKGYLNTVDERVGASRFVDLPSLFWLNSSDAAITGAAVVGVLCAALALFGVAQGWMLLLCYVLYLSFCAAGQDFLSFQWDALLLEVGFLALLIVPWSFGWQLNVAHEPHWAVRGLFYLVLFKLMFLSGVVKLMSGDPAWRDMSALSYHYWTQPLPNPLSPFMHALPMWFHKLSTAGTFMLELGFPFLIFWPRTRLIAAAGFIGLSLFIFISGNYTFFNLLTIAICFWLIPDRVWSVLFERVGWNVDVATTAAANLSPALAVLCGGLAGLSFYWCTRFVWPEAVERLVFPVLRYAQTFHISNSYGLFATMTKDRPEIVIEGSNDGKDWKEYEFRYKPGALNRPPPVIEPFHPRLDWQMWFAALGSFRDSPWLQNLMLRIFEGSPDVLGFFSHNPFPDAPPRYLRARLYMYEFTKPGDILKGLWWKRTPAGDFSPTFRRP